MPYSEPHHLTYLKHCLKTLIYCKKITRQLGGIEITPDHFALLYIIGTEKDLSQLALIRLCLYCGFSRHRRTIQNLADRCILLGWVSRTRHGKAYLHNLTLDGKTFLIDAERAIRKTRIPKHSAIDYRAKWIKAYYYRKKAASQAK